MKLPPGNIKNKMPFEIELTQTAANQIRFLRKFEQQLILDAIEKQLQYEPTQKSRSRKLLGDNELSDWEGLASTEYYIM